MAALEHHAALRQAVEVRRDQQPVPGAAEVVGAVLVGRDQQDVGPARAGRGTAVRRGVGPAGAHCPSSRICVASTR